MEDWALKGGRIEFYGVEKNSRVNILTSILRQGNGRFSVSAEMGLIHSKVEKAGSGTAGFGIGVTDEVDTDVKSACYFGKGTNAGISMKGFLFIGKERKQLPHDFNYNKFHLIFQCNRNKN